ncbi:hypothetical protein D3C83_174590 [compost metagenome]
MTQQQHGAGVQQQVVAAESVQAQPIAAQHVEQRPAMPGQALRFMEFGGDRLHR